jgi:CRP/FNR family transcriptional regulator, cyclic AMP receptor protein
MSVKKFYEKGEIIFMQGTPSSCAYIIESGTIEISDWNDGDKLVIGYLKENDIFGEMGLIDDLPRSATAIAHENSIVHVLDKETFESLSKKNPDALMPIMKVLTFRLRETLKQLNGGYKMPGSNRRLDE